MRDEIVWAHHDQNVWKSNPYHISRTTSVRVQELGGGAGSYPFAAGLRYDINFTASFGNRITNIKVNKRLEEDWAPISSATTYTVVTNSFIASGRDGYFTYTEENVAKTYVDVGIEYGQSFVNFIRAKETIEDPPLEEFSTQKIVQSDGTVCEVVPKVDETSAGAMAFSGATAGIMLLAALLMG